MKASVNTAVRNPLAPVLHVPPVTFYIAPAPPTAESADTTGTGTLQLPFAI